MLVTVYIVDSLASSFSSPIYVGNFDVIQNLFFDESWRTFYFSQLRAIEYNSSRGIHVQIICIRNDFQYYINNVYNNVSGRIYRSILIELLWLELIRSKDFVRFLTLVFDFKSSKCKVPISRFPFNSINFSLNVLLLLVLSTWFHRKLPMWDRKWSRGDRKWIKRAWNQLL